MATYLINNQSLIFDFIYYVNNNGSDSNDGLSKETSLKTTDKAYSLMTDSTKNYCIVLGQGIFDCYIPSYFPYNIPKANSISYIGEGSSTILKNTTTSIQNGGINYTLNYYKLIFDNNYMDQEGNYFSPSKQVNFYNVVLLNINDESSSSYMMPCSGGSIYFYNCVKPISSGGLLRTTNGTIKLTNCYGAFTSGYKTSQTAWDYQTNKIISSPNLDANYNILTNDWQHSGTGLNNNGTIANIGVYGGTYAWNILKYLIKQNNQYYSIKPEFYSEESDSYDPQLITDLTSDKFNTYGIDDLSEIHYNALNKLITDKYNIIMLK